MTGPINIDALKKKHRRAKAMISAAVNESAQEAANDALSHQRREVEFKPRTGALQAATTARAIRLKSGARVVLKNAKKYAASIDQGARPHWIAPLRRPMRFQIKGKWITTWFVRHPGNRAYRFLYNATKYGFRRLEGRLEARLAGVARKF